MKKGIIVLTGLMIIIGIIICLSGIFSFNTNQSYEIVNQYGDTVKMWGYGIYKNDSFFKAPIFIGTDMTMLVFTIPFMIRALIRYRRIEDQKNLLILSGLTAVLLYYSTCLAFGITFNRFHLLYTLFFSICLLGFIVCMVSLNSAEIKERQHWNINNKAIVVFLAFSGISLFVAWLPDIISALIQNKSLSLIEVYTTEVTYVIDMGIISPWILLTLFFIRQSNSMGHVFLPILTIIFTIVGLMVSFQSLFQILAEIDIPLLALISKAGIFVLLSVISSLFTKKYFKNLSTK